MRILSAEETRLALPMSDAIEAMRSAFGPDVEIPLRQQIGNSLVMPGRVGSSVGVKIVSTIPGSPNGIVVVFDEDGAPVGVVDGPTITAIRTGAIAGLATDLLAPRNASSFAMIGAGAMARDQIAAVLAVRDVDTITVWSRNRDKACTLATEVGGTCADTPAEAIRDAAIVTTATPASGPLFVPTALAAHVHVNAIGAFTPDMVEVPAEFVREAFVVVDDI
ncbi:MAG: Gfo/Idh/MocA family oxidoreductase, partial [Actinomycetota bacterium]